MQIIYQAQILIIKAMEFNDKIGNIDKAIKSMAERIKKLEEQAEKTALLIKKQNEKPGVYIK